MVQVNTRLASYPGFLTTASNCVPEAIFRLNTHPVLVFAPNTCLLFMSRISTNASEIGVLDPLSVIVPDIGVDFWFPCRLMVIVRLEVVSNDPEENTSPSPVSLIETLYEPAGTLSNVYPVWVRKV